MVHVADIMAARLNLGYAGTVDTLDVDPKVLDELKLTPSILDEVGAQAPVAYEQAQQFLN
jgi:hypothetical protein